MQSDTMKAGVIEYFLSANLCSSAYCGSRVLEHARRKLLVKNLSAQIGNGRIQSDSERQKGT